MGAGRFCFGVVLITGGHEARAARQRPVIRPRQYRVHIAAQNQYHQTLMPPAACVLPRCGKGGLTRVMIDTDLRACRAVLFDFDGVIADTMAANFQAWRSAFLDLQETLRLSRRTPRV